MDVTSMCNTQNFLYIMDLSLYFSLIGPWKSSRYKSYLTPEEISMIVLLGWWAIDDSLKHLLLLFSALQVFAVILGTELDVSPIECKFIRR